MKEVSSIRVTVVPYDNSRSPETFESKTLNEAISMIKEKIKDETFLINRYMKVTGYNNYLGFIGKTHQKDINGIQYDLNSQFEQWSVRNLKVVHLLEEEMGSGEYENEQLELN